MLTRLRSTLALLAVAVSAGCATVVDQSYPGLLERRAPIRKVAVAPFTARPEHAADAAPLLARQLTEALAARGAEVIAPEDVGHLVTAPAPGANVPALAAAVAEQFGADAVLVGEVTRWVKREGEALGSQQAAAVGVTVVLYGTPGGERLWEGSFDRTQQPLLENVLVTTRYPGGGTRWLSVEEFARFAAGELAERVPVTP